MTAPATEMAKRPNGPHACFGPFLLYPDGTLFRNATEVRLPPKELAVLRVLVAHAGEIVPAERLRLSAWGGVHVSEDSLPRCVSSLRAHLESANCIQTVYKRGYRLMLPVRLQTAETIERATERAIDRAGTFRERRGIHAAGPPRLAILPFAASDDVPEFLGAGIAEETMLRLGRTRNPVVELMARDSVFHLAARGATAREVGAALGADLAVAGTVTALATGFRLRIELIRVADAVQLWVEDFLITRDRIADADARAARRIASRIRDVFAAAIGPVQTPPHGSQHGPPVRPVSAAASAPVKSDKEAGRSEAYAIYLQACARWSSPQRHRFPMQDVLKGFQHALRLDPTLVEARIRLVRAYLTLSSYGYMRADIAAEQAREQIEIALSVSPAGQTLYPALGWIHVHHDRDFTAASEAFNRSPRCGMDGWSTIYRVRFALCQGRFTEAIGLLRTAMEADPFSPGLHARLTWALHLAGDCEAAVEQARRTQSLFPDYTGAMLFCAIVFAAASRAGDATGELPTWATAVASRLIHQAPNLDAGYATLAYVQARQGCIIEARAQLDQLQWLSRERFVLRSLQAPALVELGESDAAIDALTAAERQHCPWLFELLIDPRLEPLRSEPEFQRLRDLTQVWVSSSESVA